MTPRPGDASEPSRSGRAPRHLRIVIAGGGTGGHLYPGIAVARELLARRPDAVVTFAGTAQGVEAKVLPREGFILDLLHSAGLKGTSLMARARGFGLLPLSAIDAWRILSRRSPDLVVGVGGYSSGPVVLLAALRGIPTLLLEQNALPGVTNRLLAHVVNAAAVTFESTLSFFGRRGFVTGNPVRPEFFRADEHAGTVADTGADSRQARVLIFGGSQGAHAINLAMVAAAPGLAAAGGVDVTHQTGERDLELVRRAYGEAGFQARVEPFLFAMADEMKRADVIVCRGGATTIAEFTAAGRPAIVIPLPTAADDHQRKNAQVLAEAGAAEVIDQRQLTGGLLADRVIALAGDRTRRAAMAAAARRFARPDAAKVIVDKALELAATSERRGARGPAKRPSRGSGQSPD
jgi:UDP-N-acetylglucosamine--N-acetylmuramyl-(pentapeptide) pyrophosphoryl-undecaprenol N-acetylglucosamine transferase